MNSRDVAYWEDLARREAYFPVLSHDGGFATQGDARSSDRFFATGEEDVATLLNALSAMFGHPISLESVLDFGSGVGRLTLPLARRAMQVIACDIAPTMLAHGRKNAEAAGLREVRFISLTELAELPRESFDFICSLSVFQYVPPSEGYGLIRLLANLLVPGGIAAIQIRSERSRSAANAPAPASGIVLNTYNERRIAQCLEPSGAQVVARFPLGQSDPNDAVWIIERR